MLRLFQQEVGDFKLLPTNELSGILNGTQWSPDGLVWHEVWDFGLSMVVEVSVNGKLDERWQRRVQKLLDEGEEPLLAMEHLYEAYKSDGLRFKWIEATIAAELAIKEMLIRMEPKLETLLIELPSPSIGKLYGKVLESVAGEKSPRRKEMLKGAEKRNRLVHRPEQEILDHRQVVDYLDNVYTAIKHLLELHRRIRTSRRDN